MSPPHQRSASFRRKGRLHPQAELCPGIYNPRGQRQGREPASADVCLARAALVRLGVPLISRSHPKVHQPSLSGSGPHTPAALLPACLLPSRHNPALASGRSPVPACDPSRSGEDRRSVRRQSVGGEGNDCCTAKNRLASGRPNQLKECQRVSAVHRRTISAPCFRFTDAWQ